MKIGFFFFLLFLFTTSCQNSYPEDLIQYHYSLNEQLESSNQIIKKNTLAILKNAEKKIQKMPHHAVLYSKLDEIIRLSDAFYNEVEVIKLKFEHDFKAQNQIKILDTLRQKAQIFHKKSMELVEVSWDNGGIKGCIFADITKKQASLEQLKKSIGTPIFEQLNFNIFNKKEQALALILTQFYTLQNDIRQQENNLVRFFSSQIALYCGYDRFDVYASAQKQCIRLGETYEAGICFGDYAPITVLSLNIDNDSLPILNNRTKYKTATKQLGEQVYLATAKVQGLFSKEIDYQEQLFYFEVSP